MLSTINGGIVNFQDIFEFISNNILNYLYLSVLILTDLDMKMFVWYPTLWLRFFKAKYNSDV